MRDTGTTTRQMKAAPVGAHFVWCNAQLGYPRELAFNLGREDLKIVPPDFFADRQWLGSTFTEIVVDHAAQLSATTVLTIDIIRRTMLSRGKGFKHSQIEQLEDERLKKHLRGGRSAYHSGKGKMAAAGDVEDNNKLEQRNAENEGTRKTPAEGVDSTRPKGKA